LTLTPRTTATGKQDTLVWERVPDLEKLTPTHRRLIGFWKLVPNEGREPTMITWERISADAGSR
jgi:hypothetical protein